MNLEDTAEVSRSSLVKQHIMDWHAWRGKFGSVRNCADERIIAGCYLEWAKGNVGQAIHAVSTHCSGKYVDKPPFARCHETLQYLEDLYALLNPEELTYSPRLKPGDSKIIVERRC